MSQVLIGNPSRAVIFITVKKVGPFSWGKVRGRHRRDPSLSTLWPNTPCSCSYIDSCASLIAISLRFLPLRAMIVLSSPLQDNWYLGMAQFSWVVTKDAFPWLRMHRGGPPCSSTFSSQRHEHCSTFLPTWLITFIQLTVTKKGYLNSAFFVVSI